MFLFIHFDYLYKQINYKEDNFYVLILKSKKLLIYKKYNFFEICFANLNLINFVNIKKYPKNNSSIPVNRFCNCLLYLSWNNMGL